MATARSWIATDPTGAKQDVARLGLQKAATYNMRMLRERISDGETHWKGITRADMLGALRKLGRGNPSCKALTLRNMASVTIKRASDGSVQVSGRRLGTRKANAPRGLKLKTYEFWTDGGDEDDIKAGSLQEAAEIASRKITKSAWADGAWGIVKGREGQMDVPSR